MFKQPPGSTASQCSFPATICFNYIYIYTLYVNIYCVYMSCFPEMAVYAVLPFLLLSLLSMYISYRKYEMKNIILKYLKTC